MEFGKSRTDSLINGGEEWETKTRSRSEIPVRTVSQKFSHRWWGRLFKEIWGRPTTTADFRSSFRQIPHTSNVCLSEDKIQDWCMCFSSQFPTEAMHWIKEVETVDSVDDLKSSSSVRGIHMPNFEVLDARIASALNRIIHNTQLKKKGQSGGTKSSKKRTVSFAEDRLLTWSTSTSGVTGANDSVEKYADLFTIAVRNDDIQEFVSKWDGILLSMTKIPPDEILEGVYKERMRESEKLKSVLELFDLEIHQKKAGPDYHRLKTMVKRRIEQNLRMMNFAARNGNYEGNAVVKNQGTKQRGQRILGDCWQWESNGQCSNGDNCSFRNGINKRAKMTQPNPSQNSFMQQSERNASRTQSPRGKSQS